MWLGLVISEGDLMKTGHSNLLILSESIITVDLETNMEEDLNPQKPKVSVSAFALFTTVMLNQLAFKFIYKIFTSENKLCNGSAPNPFQADVYNL